MIVVQRDSADLGLEGGGDQRGTLADRRRRARPRTGSSRESASAGSAVGRRTTPPRRRTPTSSWSASRRTRRASAPITARCSRRLEGCRRALCGAGPAGNVPLVVFESTLAPSSMATVIRDHSSPSHGLVEGRDVLLGNSPNRVMPGRLVERVRDVGQDRGRPAPATPGLIARLYSPHRHRGRTAPDQQHDRRGGQDARERLPRRAHRVRGRGRALLRRARHRLLRAPRPGERGSWRRTDAGVRRPERRAERRDSRADRRRRRALPAEGRHPALVARDRGGRRHLAQPDPRRPPHQRRLARGDDRTGRAQLRTAPGKGVALLGAAYRFNSEDTRNSPTLVLANLLRQGGCAVTVHDPYVKPDDQNLRRMSLDECFTQDLGQAVAEADVLLLCTAHRESTHRAARHGGRWRRARGGLFDGCNLITAARRAICRWHAGLEHAADRARSPAAFAASSASSCEPASMWLERGVGN